MQCTAMHNKRVFVFICRPGERSHVLGNNHNSTLIHRYNSTKYTRVTQGLKCQRYATKHHETLQHQLNTTGHEQNIQQPNEQAASMLYDARPRVGLNPLTTVSEPAGLRPLNSAALSASSVLQLSSSNRINREQQHTRQHHRERSNCEDQSERILCSSTLPLSLTFLERYNGLICKRTAIAELPRAIACVCWLSRLAALFALRRRHFNQ